MSQPPYPYNRIFDFESFSINTPAAQQPGVQLEGEYDAIKRTIDSLISRLAEIQRDDGKLRGEAFDITTASAVYVAILALLQPTLALKANLASPALTGTPTAPTPATNNNSTTIATTAFVKAQGYATTSSLNNAIDGVESLVDAVNLRVNATNEEVTHKLDKRTGGAVLEDVTLNKKLHVYGYSPEIIVQTTNSIDGIANLTNSFIQFLNGYGSGYSLINSGIMAVSRSTVGFAQLQPNKISVSNQFGALSVELSSAGLKFLDGTLQSTAFTPADYATNTSVDTKIANLVNSAPGTLNTLGEIATALGNDANLATTLTNSIATKLPLTGGAITGGLEVDGDLEIFGGETGRTYINGNTISTNTEGNTVNLNSNATSAWITFNDGSNQYTAGLPLTGGTVTGNVTFAPSDMVQTITVLEGSVELKNNPDVPVSTDGIKLNTNGSTIEIASAGDVMLAGYSAYGFNVSVDGRPSINVNGDGSNFVKVFNTNNVNSYTDHSDAGIKIYEDAAELVELGSWGLGISDTNGGTGGNTSEVQPTGLYVTTAVNQIGDSSNSYLKSGELKIGTTTNFEPETSFIINSTGIKFPNGSLQYTAGLALTGGTLTGKLNIVKSGYDAPLNLGIKTGLTNGIAGDISLLTNGLIYVDGSNVARTLVNTSGATFTGKVNISAGSTISPLNIGSGISPSTSIAGDIWIGTTGLFYKDSSGTLRQTITTSQSNTFTNSQTINFTGSGSPALTVLQNGNGGGVLIQNPTGTGYSFKVEDSTTPDATPFTIDASGRVGIGVAPDATVALTVDSTGIKVNGATLVPASTVSNPPLTSGNMSHSEYLKELVIIINGVNYAIPLRVV